MKRDEIGVVHSTHGGLDTNYIDYNILVGGEYFGNRGYGERTLLNET
jgi:hypothetical protein